LASFKPSPHDLDDVDLVAAGLFQLDVELRLLLDRGCPGGSRAGRESGDGDGRRFDAPLVLQRLDELRDLDDREVREVIDDLVFRNFGHD
jgi:hypothetical protein